MNLLVGAAAQTERVTFHMGIRPALLASGGDHATYQCAHDAALTST
jgi:hypothetical protein